jgi:hypothetical protein
MRLAPGDGSAALSDMRRDLEATAVLERSAVADLKGRAEEPVPLSAVDALSQRVVSLVDLLESKQPERAREVLRGYLRGGQITLTPEHGVYVARAGLFPLKVMLDESSSGNLRCPELVARGRNASWIPRYCWLLKGRWWPEERAGMLG